VHKVGRRNKDVFSFYAVHSIRFLKQMAWWQPRLCSALRAVGRWTLKSLLSLCIPVLPEMCNLRLVNHICPSQMVNSL